MLSTFCRWWFAPIIIAVWSGAGILCALGLNAVEPIGELDYWFYVNLYTAIGAMFGAATWYCAHLVAGGHFSLRALGLTVLIPYGFILMVSIDTNPIVSVIATIGFGGILLLAYLASRAAEVAVAPEEADSDAS